MYDENQNLIQYFFVDSMFIKQLLILEVQIFNTMHYLLCKYVTY